MNWLKQKIRSFARKFVADEIEAAQRMAVVPSQTLREIEVVQNENEGLKHELWQLGRVIQHHETRIKQMAPEKQFVIVAPDGTVLEQQMVYSSAGNTRITVKLPLGHPWKQITEMAQELELANFALERAQEAITNNKEVRQKYLGSASTDV